MGSSDPVPEKKSDPVPSMPEEKKSETPKSQPQKPAVQEKKPKEEVKAKEPAPKMSAKDIFNARKEKTSVSGIKPQNLPSKTPTKEEKKSEAKTTGASGLKKNLTIEEVSTLNESAETNILKVIWGEFILGRDFSKR